MVVTSEETEEFIEGGEPESASLAQFLRGKVEVIANDYRSRHVFCPEELRNCREWIVGELAGMGYRAAENPGILASFAENVVGRQEFTASFWTDVKATTASEKVQNLVVNLPGEEALPLLIVGAHYDSRKGMLTQKGRMPHFDWDSETVTAKQKAEFEYTPGANDNGSGVAALLALAKAWKGKRFRRPVQLVFWVNEEYPFFRNYFAEGRVVEGEDGVRRKYQAEGMGSFVHAGALKAAGIPVYGAIAFDTCGIYRDGRGLETDGMGLFEKLGVYLAMSRSRSDVKVLSDWDSKSFAKEFAAAYQKTNAEASHPVWWKAFPDLGSGWSDDWAYWQHDIPAFCITDGAYLRARTYHRTSDRPETLTYEAFATAWEGWRAAIEVMLGRGPEPQTAEEGAMEMTSETR